MVRFGYNDLSDLGDGFAQEVNTSILRQHLQQAQLESEERDGHMGTLQVSCHLHSNEELEYLELQ